MPVSSMMCVVGARPNFMKMAPIYKQLSLHPTRFAPTLVHTGQHYDEAMSKVFFDQLGMPRPDVDLNVGSGSHAFQTAAIMTAFEPVLLKERPALVIVVGDVNSTIACALVAVKLGIKVAHVEAGLRSFDRTMPEEINRLLTDQISDLLFTTEASAEENLRREGIPPEKIHFVGNVMIDTLLAHRERAREMNAPARYGLGGRFALVTLHRPANVDDPERFEGLISALHEIANEMPLVFPVHPRTRSGMTRSPTAQGMVDEGRLRIVEPLPYLDFVSLMQAAALVITDSGGIQEETTILGVPCLTLRDNTERPVTVTCGTNVLAGTERAGIVRAWECLRSRKRPTSIPALWDGSAAQRIVDVIDRSF
jgi:UDP-N-acetylglucosamine 2-epimerase (non-hydrolysing)